MLTQLEEHINEIEFCLQSLNLGLTMIASASSLYPNSNNNGSGESTKTTDTVPKQHTLSPSCLLKASNRITVMHRSGGDVAVCFGQLFRKNFYHSQFGGGNEKDKIHFATAQWRRMFIFLIGLKNLIFKIVFYNNNKNKNKQK
ncbi:hypothetical protein RFI_07742 [Reticulomyxa filosa]|uniref:Uncharacterized protein n=1 Tax=Reticulomyxa filosa TaxID=46433 RepID=X6NTY0_RETFI|nr:hypothetical protein RFI_07742 [Reticulomyxa filosa]|eukprot:ETO29378.1 hypothetical protein RFI_07742 [Reticulomyxa filosa]